MGERPALTGILSVVGGDSPCLQLFKTNRPAHMINRTILIRADG